MNTIKGTKPRFRLEQLLFLSHSELPREQKQKRLDLMATILLSMAAVLSAVSAYQASRWYSEMNIDLAESSNFRAASAKVDRNTNRHILGDMMLFLEWANAFRNKDSSLMIAVEDRFSQPFKNAFTIWKQQKEKGAAGLLPVGTHFEMKEYSALLTESQRLIDESDAKFRRAKHAATVGDDFIFSLVIFSLSLFFGAVCTKIGTPFYQAILLWIGVLIALLGAAIVSRLPWNTGF